MSDRREGLDAGAQVGGGTFERVGGVEFGAR